MPGLRRFARSGCVALAQPIASYAKGGFAMAGPQFVTPPGVTPSRHKRRFTLEQANRAIAYVGRVVADIVRAHELILTLQAKLEDLRGKAATAAERQLADALDRLQSLVDELTEVGCELKDYESGLVDFVGRHQGRDIYLCWKLGEPRVTHWHELTSGYAGRQPISVLDERE
jgi:hypothetical protein